MKSNKNTQTLQIEDVRSNALFASQDVTDANEKAKESQLNFQAIFENTSDGFILTDINGIIKSFNSKARDRIRLNTEEEITVGKKVFDFLPDSRKKMFKDNILKVLSGKTLHYDYPYTRKNGETKWFSFTINPVYNADNIEGIAITSTDITERKSTELRLRDEEAQMRDYFENVHAAILVMDMSRNGSFRRYNKNALKLFKFKPEEFYSKTPVDISPAFQPDGRRSDEKALELINSAMAGNKPVFEWLSKDAEGNEILCDVSLVRLSGYYEKHLLVSIIDITERKIAEEKLIQSEKHSRDLFEQSIIGLALARMDGTLVDVNEAYAKIIGHTIEETKKLTYLEITPEKYLEQENEILKELNNTGKFMNYEKEYIHKNGHLVPVRLSGNIIEKDGERFIWSSIEDITEKKKLEKALEAERDQFYDMFVTAPSAIGMLKGADHVFEMVNPIYLQLIGKKDVIGKTVAEVLPEVIEQGFIDLLDNVYNTGKSYIGTEVLVKLDKEGNGELTDAYLNFVYQAYKNDEGNIGGVFFFANDITEQIQSRKAIEKSERFFKGVIENSDDMITMMDQAGKTIYASPAVSKKFGYTQAECLSMNMADVLHPDDSLIMQEFVVKVMMHPGVPMECPLIRDRKKDGTYIWVEGILTNFLETEGINAIVANFRDVTERKIAHELIVRSEANLSAIIENTEASIYSLDRDLRYITFNNILYDSMKQIYGLDIKPGDNVYNFLEKLNPDEANEWKKVYSKALKGETVKFEKEFSIHDYHSFFEFSIHPIWENKNVIGLSCFAIDITKQKKADEKDKFQARLLNTIGQAAIATDLNGIINYWNQAAEDIYGWTKEEALGNNIIDLTPSETTAEQGIQIMEKLKSGETWSGEFKVRKKDGTNFPAQVTDSPIYDENNILSGIIGISSDISEKRKLEKLLDKSNKLARIGSWEIDVKKRTVFWSDITKEIREADPDFAPELTNGMQLFKEGNDRDTISKRVKDCIEKGIPWDDELQMITQKGNLKWIRTIGEGEFINGKCIRVYGSFQDIDTRKKAELEVLKTYEEKNIILESIGDGFYTLDKNWIITYWNSQAEKMLGKAKHEMLGKNLWEVFPEAVNTPPYTTFVKAARESTIQHFERFNEGLKKWYQVSVYPSANGLSVYFQDVTERKVAEQQVKADKNLLRTLIDNLPDTIFYKDKSAKKLISNKFDYYSVLGADTEQEVLGKTDLELSSHANASMTYAQDMEILNTGKPLINFEEYFTTADNQPLWLSTSKLPLRNDKNEIIGLLGIGRDITERKIAEEKLIELNKALEKNIKQLVISNAELEQFAYVASHDLQEPLRMITSFLTLLEKKYRGVIDAKGQQYIDFAVDGGIRMRQIILDLLEFSRIGRVEDKTEEVDLNELVDEIIRLHSKQINETKAVLNIAKLPVLNISRTPMRQVFQNLISNGLKYHKDGVVPQISISVNSVGEFWQFAISDNGIGIGSAYLDKIFIIFQRLHNKEKYSGTGIGLSITKKIIEGMGGSIRVESEEGKGSTFYFTIPK